MKQIILFLALGMAWHCIPLQCCGQTNKSTIRPEIKALADGIAADNVFKSKGIGIAGQRTEQWERFEKLKENATDSELIWLTDSKNAVVRCYAFQALTFRNYSNLFPILLKHINDTAGVETFSGCVKMGAAVNETIFMGVHPRSRYLNAYRLTKAQMTLVDSIFLFDKNIRFWMKDIFLECMEPKLKYYQKIREITLSGKLPVAVLMLAKFKNRNDIGIIREAFNKKEMENYAVLSVREFPHASFYPVIKKKFEKKWAEFELDRLSYADYDWEWMYEALARYPSEETYRLFEKSTQLKDYSHYQTLNSHLLIAITLFPDTKYAPLKAKIKLDKYHQSQLEEELRYRVK